MSDVDDTGFGVPFVYCLEHLSAHETGWCGVDCDRKIPLLAETQASATAEVIAHGWPLYGGSEETMRRNLFWGLTGYLIDRRDNRVIDDRRRHVNWLSSATNGDRLRLSTLAH